MKDTYTDLQNKCRYGDLGEAYREFYRIVAGLATGPWTVLFIVNNIKCAVSAAEMGLRRMADVVAAGKAERMEALRKVIE